MQIELWLPQKTASGLDTFPRREQKDWVLSACGWRWADTGHDTAMMKTYENHVHADTINTM